MGRQRSPNRDKAFKIYKRHNGDIRNKEIAEILGEDPKTVSKWKKLDKWDEKLEKEDFSKENSKNNKTDSTYDYVYVDESEIEVEEEKVINEIEEFDEMNEKHLLFCIYYIQCFNATKAYQKVYRCNSVTASVNGCKLLSNTNIQIAITKLKQNRLNKAMLSPEDIYQKYIDIAFANLSDYVKLTNKEVDCLAADGTIKKIKIAEIEYNDTEFVDGYVLQELKETKNGISIKLKDSMKALEWLSAHMDLATEEQKARVESLRNKVRVDNERLELEKKKFEREDF